MATIDQWLENGRGGMTDERLSEVFDLVKTPGNWKDPIDAKVSKGLATLDEIERAVAWFAGGYPTIVEHDDHFRVTGSGYYSWIGS